MLAGADVLLQLRGPGHPLGEPLRRDERVVAEHQAVGRQRGTVHSGRHRAVHPGQRVVRNGAEGPPGILVHLGERLGAALSSP